MPLKAIVIPYYLFRVAYQQLKVVESRRKSLLSLNFLNKMRQRPRIGLNTSIDLANCYSK